MKNLHISHFHPNTPSSIEERTLESLRTAWSGFILNLWNRSHSAPSHRNVCFNTKRFLYHQSFRQRGALGSGPCLSSGVVAARFLPPPDHCHGRPPRPLPQACLISRCPSQTQWTLAACQLPASRGPLSHSPPQPPGGDPATDMELLCLGPQGHLSICSSDRLLYSFTR